MTWKVDDPGKAAIVAFEAARLFCDVSGMNAENDQRKSNGYAMAYTDTNYEGVAQDSLARLREAGVFE